MNDLTTSATSNINWKEIGITAGIVLVAGFAASLAALYAYDGLKKMAAKKASSKKESDAKK